MMKKLNDGLVLDTDNVVALKKYSDLTYSVWLYAMEKPFSVKFRTEDEAREFIDAAMSFVDEDYNTYRR